MSCMAGPDRSGSLTLQSRQATPLHDQESFWVIYPVSRRVGRRPHARHMQPYNFTLSEHLFIAAAVLRKDLARTCGGCGSRASRCVSFIFGTAEERRGASFTALAAFRTSTRV